MNKKTLIWILVGIALLVVLILIFFKGDGSSSNQQIIDATGKVDSLSESGRDITSDDNLFAEIDESTGLLE